jgi:hypothetical protein
MASAGPGGRLEDRGVNALQPQDGSLPMTSICSDVT